MIDHWEKSGPPVYIAAAAYLGLNKTTKKEGSTDRSKEKGDLNQLAKLLAGSEGILSG